MNATDNEITFSEFLSDIFSSEQVQISQLYRLSDMTPDEFSEFKSRWPAEAAERRYEIIRHLADISEESFLVEFSPVFSICLTDSDSRIRQSALEGLWDSSNTDLAKAILDLLVNDSVPQVRAAAARSLTHYLIMAQWGQITGLDINQVVTTLLQVYNDPGVEEDVKSSVLEAMSPVSNKEIYRKIEEAFESASSKMQLSAIFAMGNSADSRWIPLLMDEMENPSPEYRGEAARAAGKIGDSKAVDQLIELVDDVDEDVALAAVTALGQIGGERANNILQTILDDPEYEMFHEVAEEALEEAEWSEVNDDLFKLFDFDEEEGSLPDFDND